MPHQVDGGVGPFPRRTLSDKVFIGFVVANPEPQKTVGLLNARARWLNVIRAE